MTVKELIEELQKYPPEKEVLVYESGYGAEYEVQSLAEFRVDGEDKYNGSPVLYTGDEE